MERKVTSLPLHYGKAPGWLFEKMNRFVGALIEIIVIEFGSEEFLKRISDPIWFQALGCAAGFDWHSSGLTTTVCGAIKVALKGKTNELKIAVCGGKGREALKTPSEIKEICESWGVDLSYLVEVSRLCAKIDNALLQDGYDLYHHTFIFDQKGNWTVIQQGMDPLERMARRYQWHSEIQDFFSDPHTGITCDRTKKILNLASRESALTRDSILEFLKEKPEKIWKTWDAITLSMPKRHYIDPVDIDQRRLYKVLHIVHEKHPSDFEELIKIKGVGSKTLSALSLVSELVFKNPPSFKDPARFSFAHGGKDGYPFPVNKKIYERTIYFLKECVEKARIGDKEKLFALRKLSSL